MGARAKVEKARGQAETTIIQEGEQDQHAKDSQRAGSATQGETCAGASEQDRLCGPICACLATAGGGAVEDSEARACGQGQWVAPGCDRYMQTHVAAWPM